MHFTLTVNHYRATSSQNQTDASVCQLSTVTSTPLGTHSVHIKSQLRAVPLHTLTLDIKLGESAGVRTSAVGKTAVAVMNAPDARALFRRRNSWSAVTRGSSGSTLDVFIFSEIPPVSAVNALPAQPPYTAS